MKIIGSADEFWRLRLTRVDTTEDVDFEWHDDVLYREPRTAPVRELELWHVEALRHDDYEVVIRLATFQEREQAEAFLERAREDLSEMTKSQFEAAYLAEPPALSVEDE